MIKRRSSRLSTAEQKVLHTSPKAAAGVSNHRRGTLQEEIEQGLVREGKSYTGSRLQKRASDEVIVDGPKYNRGQWMPADGHVSSGAQRTMVRAGDPEKVTCAVVHSASFVANGGALLKQATTVGSVGGASGTSAGAAVERLAPEVYSPLFTMANLNLPRDRITVNAWARNFFQLHPIVRNAITLHATYPISKLNLKCHDRKVLQFFEDMIEEMGLMESIGDLALEYWKLGEVFPYAELDENTGKWSRIVIQNPDYIHVKKMVLSGEPIISLKPDSVLQRLVFSNNPADVQLRQQIPEKILYHVRAGHDIPLDNFNISHLKMLASPYDVRGTSIIVSVFKDLMLYDKLRECYSEDTEFLTNNGFKKYNEITDEDQLGTFNRGSGQLEYQHYTNRTQYHYEGDMYHFKGQKIDVLVTPNHRMWLSKYNSKKGYEEFKFIRADEVNLGMKYKSRSVVKWEGKDVESVNILGSRIPIKDYLEFLGYIISDGSVRFCKEKGSYCTALSQLDKSNEFSKMEKSFYKIGNLLKTHVSIGKTKSKNGFVVSWRLYGKELAEYFNTEIGSGAYNKHIPQWIKGLSTDLLKIILRALVDGDGRILTGDLRGDTKAYSYSTVSKKLANDVQELAFKCGYAPRLDIRKNGNGTIFYTIIWSIDTSVGKFPYIYDRGAKRGSRGAEIKKVFYNGDVSCFEVPNSLLITKRNGLISIQGNSKFAQADGLINPLTIIKVGGNTEGEYRATQEDLELYKNMLEEAQYDKDFKLVTHAGVDISRVGASGQVLEIASDMELIIKNIYTGLMVPPAVVDTESAVYASASIGLEVLRQRYFNFRAIIAGWLVEKIFAPISEIQGFYEFVDGTKRLIVPEVEWNQMNLYDLQDYIGNITGLVGSKQASLQTLYRSLGLNYEDERIKMRQEMIHEAVRRKEEMILGTMTLAELRTLDPEKDILEPVDDHQREGGEGGGLDMSGGAGAGGMPPELGGAGGMPGGGGMPSGLPELAPPPGGELGVPGAGAPPGGGLTPPLGPGGPGMPEGGGL